MEDGDELLVIDIGTKPLRLGRSPAADVMLEHLSVSRRHAVVATRGDVVVVLDDRSLNGVVVNEGTEASVTKGKILLQSEGAEVFYRNITLTPLTK